MIPEPAKIVSTKEKGITHCPPYSDQITAAESALGFVLAVIPDLYRSRYGNKSICRGVVYSIAPGVRIIKVQDPNGIISYEHQEYGKRSASGTPDWITVFHGLPDATIAIETARQKRRNYGVIPVPATLSLRCPACRTHFELEADCVPIGETTKCPYCKRTAPCEEFVATNRLDAP